jgi:hypothetical protein
MVLQYLVINPDYELHRDEFLYLNQADHLAFGYISVPPLTALFSKIVFILGDGIFWVRFFPGLFGALTVVFVWLIVEAAGGQTGAKILASTAIIFSALLRLNILYQPNSFDVLIWTIIFYLLIRFIQTEKDSWLYWLAIIISAGFYNKYNIVFLIAGLTAGLLVTNQRRIFAKRTLWLAMVLSLILLSPNIIWQVTNNFPVFQHMKVLKANQLDNNSATGFLINQALFFAGSALLTIMALWAFIFYKPFRSFRFIGIAFVTVITLFAIMKAKGYYAVGIYPVVISLGSVYLESILSSKWNNLIIPVLISINLLVFILTFKVVYPVYSPAKIRENAGAFEKMGMLRWEDGKNHNLPQDFADMLGWKEMAVRSLEAYKMIPPEEAGNTLVICSNYGQAGAINYYNRGKMAEAYAFNTDYIYWLPVLNRIDNVVFIGQKPSDDVIRAFKNFKQTGIVENEYAREHGTAIFLMTGASPLFTNAFYNLVDEKKKKKDIF